LKIINAERFIQLCDTIIDISKNMKIPNPEERAKIEMVKIFRGMIKCSMEEFDCGQKK